MSPTNDSREQELEVCLMDSLHTSPFHHEPSVKKPYSSPRLVDLGAIEELSLAGSGTQAEGPGSMNVKRKP